MSGRLFAALLVVTLAFRCWLAAALPITGDEAYFIWWGMRPDWGFYDHPPMVGWWLAALLHIGDTPFWLRLPSTMQPAILAVGVVVLLRRLAPGLSDAQRHGIGLLVLLAPANVWNVAITTDTPLVYFCVFSGLAWWRAASDDDWRWYLVSGILLAGAVLSKYFVALLGFAYLVDVLRRRTKDAWLGLLIAYAATVPALALMVWWNAGHCWPNYMFNFVNRHTQPATLSLTNPALYAASLLYLLTPPALWLAWRWRRGGSSSVHSGAAAVSRRLASADFFTHPALATLGTLAWAPLALFAALALFKQVGLHWLLAFLPFVLIWLGLRLPLPTLRRLGCFFIGCAVLHMAVFLVVSRLPLETWRKSQLYDGLVLTFDAPAVLRALGPIPEGWALAMDGYSNAVTLGYNARRYVFVFGEGSSHARHDDILTDFRALDGRNILVLRKTKPDLADYAPYFRRLSVESFDVRGVRFWRVKGEGFNYPAYRDKVLETIRREYYAVPSWLPQTACYFCDRYFPDRSCHQ